MAAGWTRSTVASTRTPATSITSKPRSPSCDGKCSSTSTSSTGGSTDSSRSTTRSRTQALRRIEAGLADEIGRREILARDLAELKHQVAVLQSRIAEIEQRLGR
jgi:hypothetical protein